MKLKKFGFFNKMNHMEAVAFLRMQQRAIADPHERDIIRYLKSGAQLIAIPGLAIDILNNNKDIIGPPHVFTDGEWAWTADVPYYVEHYHLMLPENFLQKMAVNDWQCPIVKDLQKLNLEGWGPTE